METILDSLASTPAVSEEVFCRLIQGGISTTITRGTVSRESSRYAALLAQRGVKEGQVVLIILRHSPDLFYAFLGAMMIGAVPSFMPPVTSKQDIKLYWSSHRTLFGRIETGALLTYRANVREIEDNLGPLGLLLIEAEQVKGIEFEIKELSCDPNQIALLQHSSGTTGLKKGVALTHAAVLTQVEKYTASLKLNANDRIVSWLPLYHDMGLITSFLVPLITKTELVLLDPLEWVVNPRSLFEAIRTYGGTLCWQPNFAFHHLCRVLGALPGFDLSSMRAWIDCSEPCRPETFALFEKTFSKAGVQPHHLQVCYAMAETVFAVTQTELGKKVRTVTLSRGMESSSGNELELTQETGWTYLSTGYPMPGMEVRIVGPDGKILP